MRSDPILFIFGRNRGFWCLDAVAERTILDAMKRMNWGGLLICSSLAFAAAPACGGDDDSSGGDGDGDAGDGDSGDGDAGDGDAGDGDVGDGDAGDGDAGDGDSGDGDGDGGMGGGGASGDGDMGGSMGDGDGDTTGDGDGVTPVIGQDCQDYCADWFETSCNDHVEPGNQYADEADCGARCEGFTTALDEAACRRIHLTNAMGQAPNAAEMHCGHAAETPTAVCEP